jgi:DeoR family fructose operon transcriptional repressor
MIGQMYFDKTFSEVSGIHPEKGLTIDDPAETGIKQALIQQSKEVIVMATPSRIGHIAPVKLGETTDVHRLLAHSGASTSPVLEAIQKRGVAITYV